MSGERERTTFMLWHRVNEIAVTTEDMSEIRNLIAEAGIAAGTHVGTPAEDFTPLMVAEWVLGNWIDMIDAKSPFLNSARNVSLHQWEENALPLGYPAAAPWTIGESAS